MEKLVFSECFLRFVGKNQSQDLQGPQLIILTKYECPPTTPDPIYIDSTFLISVFFFVSILSVFRVFC